MGGDGMATMGRILSGKPETANFRQTAPETHVWPQFAAHSWPAVPQNG
jgi:hypothetical protein